MASFGENLQREREMRGVTLEEISEATKISMRFLQAVESENFAKLPGGIFTRSFIRTYARYLGLDEESVLAEYQLLTGGKSEVDLHRLAAARPQSTRESSRTPLLALLAAAILLGGGYALFRYSRRLAEITVTRSNPGAASAAPAQTVPASSSSGGTTTPPSQNSATPSPAPANGAETSSTLGQVAPADTGLTTPPQTAGSQSGQASNSQSTQASKSEGGLVLQVAATERSWVAVDGDGKALLQRVLNPNEVATLKAKDSFDVTTGNAQGVILTLNGETLKPLGRRGEVKSLHLTHEDAKNPTP
jgi:cytoskeleton protein RodZ